MCTWTSKVWAVVAISTLAACGGGGGGTGLTSLVSRAAGPEAQSSVAVAADQVVIAGPSGFCVDPDSSQTSAAVPFVMLGNCATISGNSRATQPDVKAVLTASVGPPDSGGAIAGASAEMDRYFRSDEGRRTLSRDGDAATVQVLDSFEEAGIFYLRSSDTSAAPFPDVSEDQWRAYMEVNGRLVSAAVLGFKDAPMEAGRERALIQDFAREIRVKSIEGAAATPVAAIPAAVAPTPAAAPEPTRAPSGDTAAPSGTGGLRGIGLFRRLLG